MLPVNGYEIAASGDEAREQPPITPAGGADADSAATPAASETVLTEDQLAESKAYGRQRVYCHLVDIAMDVVLLGVVALLAARPLDDWLQSSWILENVWLRLAAFFVILAGMQYVVSFPLSFYAGYRLEHQYGLSRQTPQRWFRRDLLKHALMLGLGLVMIEGLFFLIRYTGPFWWLTAAVASFLISVVLGQLVPVVILPLFYKIDRLEDPALAERFERLAEGTSLSIEGVYRMQLSSETAKANAMLAGLGRTRRVLLGDTLLEGFTPEEIEVVLAHEIGHHVFHHIPKLIAGGLILSLAGFFLCDRLLLAGLAGADFSYARFPVHGLPLLMLLITLFSLLTSPLTHAISRRFERQCDRYALDRTGRDAAYVSAFTKLARLNKADPQPHPLEVLLLHDHPPIAERLAMANPPAND